MKEVLVALKEHLKRVPSNDAFGNIGNITEEQMDELERGQMKYVPQHEPGAPENFIKTSERLKYLAEALALKLGKYGYLNIPRQASSSTHIPLALSLAGFVQYYGPGKLICCGLVRENSHMLEKHISRSHRPPKPGPSLAIVTPQIDSLIVNDTETDSVDIRQTKITNDVILTVMQPIFLALKVPKAKWRIDPAQKALPVFKRINTNSLSSTSLENRKIFLRIMRVLIIS
ncbi:hypothetical protein GHT06_016948 [Daphnia sinensis]|uniref:Uncharacterized protein n=1 Tax=Daphnia sinensis TaxID=1820382 RepID=A0AAD5L6W1_9CRUS|nr:hypothetical protein GHT06_016948 [Daphnia sinensis]